jgi:hypothetical protein
MLALVIVIVAVAALVVLIAGRTMGTPPAVRRFDETPADIAPLDVPDRTPLDLRYEPLAVIDDICFPARRKVVSPDEIDALERLSDHIKSERRF